MRPNNRKEYRQRRHLRIRKRIRGTAERPRMALCVSNRHFYVQFIDDDAAVTLAAAQSSGTGNCNVAGARAVGERAGQAAVEKGIREVVVDRGGFRFHGRIRTIVEAVEAAGVCIRKNRDRKVQEVS